MTPTAHVVTVIAEPADAAERTPVSTSNQTVIMNCGGCPNKTKMRGGEVLVDGAFDIFVSRFPDSACADEWLLANAELFSGMTIYRSDIG